MHGSKHLVALLVFLQVNFHIMGKETLPHIADQIGLSNLARTVDQQDLVLLFLEILLKDRSKLPF